MRSPGCLITVEGFAGDTGEPNHPQAAGQIAAALPPAPPVPAGKPGMQARSTQGVIQMWYGASPIWFADPTITNAPPP